MNIDNVDDTDAVRPTNGILFVSVDYIIVSNYLLVNFIKSRIAIRILFLFVIFIIYKVYFEVNVSSNDGITKFKVGVSCKMYLM